MTARVEGDAAAGYEPVAEAFEAAASRGHGSADCCVYVDGECVVDLRYGRRADQVQCVFSATKGVVAACANLLVERGMLELEAPVIRYWPEFGAHGKGNVTVRELLEHRAGVLAPDATLDADDLGDWDVVCAALADATPAWEPGTAYGYHAQSFGWLAGELVHRADGRGLVEFFTTEIAQPAGADVLLGLPDAAARRLLDVELATPAAPTDAAPEAADMDPSQFVGPHTDVAMTLGGALPDDTFAVPADPRLRGLPIAASNGYTNATGLARLYAWLLTAVSPATLRDLTIARTSGPDAVLSSPAFDIEQRFSRGFEVIVPTDGGQIGFGHHGLGGSTAFADPTQGLAFAYTTTSAVLGPPGADPRAHALAQATYTSAIPPHVRTRGEGQ